MWNPNKIKMEARPLEAVDDWFKESRMKGHTVKFSANKWSIQFHHNPDPLFIFTHPEAPDEPIFVRQSGGMDISEWWNVNKHNPKQIDKMIWRLIDKGILFHPYEILN